jgi:hypothetical protein
LRVAVGILILCVLSCLYGFFYKEDTSETPDYLNAYSLGEFIVHYKQHIKLIKDNKNAPLIALLLPVLLPALLTIRAFNLIVATIQYLKFLKEY